MREIGRGRGRLTNASSRNTPSCRPGASPRRRSAALVALRRVVRIDGLERPWSVITLRRVVRIDRLERPWSVITLRRVVRIDRLELLGNVVRHVILLAAGAYASRHDRRPANALAARSWSRCPPERRT